MKIKLSVEKKYDLDSEVLIKMLVKSLGEKDYKIAELTDTNVVFEEDPFGVRSYSRSDYYTRISNCKIVLIITGKETVLKFFYRISFTSELIMLSLLSMGGIWLDYRIFVFFIFFLSNFLVRVYYLNNYFVDNMIDIKE